ncbi:hypothetical protein [Stenotrophomonas sp. UBA7606]|uniref:hypothetical protein n=1 Tax=Stenotrophomonas sp. UBA7606 TaxID=1947559 RepID=UPI0025E54C53|nr:hypothetical protein [Stenotrophomonas sp. UBA7606]
MEEITRPASCITEDELTRLRNAYVQYGTGDGFWGCYEEVLAAAAARYGCDRSMAVLELQKTFQALARVDDSFVY